MIVLYFIIGIIGGVLGGMGMGGGTLLIPLLTIITKTPQKIAQAVNLISFIPMAIIALVIHTKNKMVDYKGSLYIIVPGVILSVGGALLAKIVTGDALKKIFGGFLIILSIIQFLTKTEKEKT